MCPKVVIPTVEETLALQAARIRHLESLEHGIEPFTAHLHNPRARIYRSTSQVIGTGAWTAISFSHERFDTDGIWALAPNPHRLTCQTAGDYIIIGHYYWARAAGGRRVCRVQLNGTTDIAVTEIGSAAGAAEDPGQNVSTIYRLSVADFVELLVWQNSGGPVNITSNAEYSPEFMMARVG